MQFAIFTSTFETDIAPHSEIGTLDEGASVIIEGEEETELVTEDEQETGNNVDDKEEAEDEVQYEETEVSSEELRCRKAENSVRNMLILQNPQK
jgi:hypothetical protein